MIQCGYQEVVMNVLIEKDGREAAFSFSRHFYTRAALDEQVQLEAEGAVEILARYTCPGAKLIKVTSVSYYLQGKAIWKNQEENFHWDFN